MSTAEEEETFERTAKVPLVWQLTARQLIVAGNRLRDGYDAAKENMSIYATKLPVLLLFGLAAENLVKGLLVAKGTVAPVVRDKKGSLRLNSQIKSHDLVALCQKAGVSLSDEDREVLRNLTWAIESGKYPVPTRARSSPTDPPPMWVEWTNLDRVCAVLARLEDELRGSGNRWILDKTEIAKLGL